MKFNTPKNMLNDSIQSKFNDIFELQNRIINYIETDGKDVLSELVAGKLYDGTYKNKLIMVNDQAGQPLITITQDGTINRLRPFSPLNPEQLNDDMEIIHHVEINDNESIQFSPVSDYLDIPIINEGEKISLDEDYIKQAEQVYQESLNIILNKVQGNAAKKLPGVQKKLYGFMDELTEQDSSYPDTIDNPEIQAAGRIFTMTAFLGAFSESIESYFEDPEMGSDIRNDNFQEVISNQVQEFFDKQNGILEVYSNDKIPLPSNDSELDYGTPPYLLADEDILMPFFLVQEDGTLVKLLPFLEVEEHLSDDYEMISTTMIGAIDNLVRFIPVYDTFKVPEFESNYQFLIEDSIAQNADEVYTMIFSSFESILRDNASGNIVGLYSALKTYMSENDQTMDGLVSDGVVYNELRAQIANAMQMAMERTEMIMNHLLEDLMQQMH